MVVTFSSIEHWQMLRVLVRNGNKPLAGQELRISRSRQTKDGTFLDKFVELGLLERVGDGPPPSNDGRSPKPAQFRALYRLTPAGLAAADTGEYERPDPVKLPVVTKGRARR